MLDATLVLLSISFILFFGILAEYLFKRLHVPDVLFLIGLGFAIGPYGFEWVSPQELIAVAPLFTTFALLFLLFEGAFNIDLASFTRGLAKSMAITSFNFLISVTVVTGVMMLFRHDFLFSLLVGCILGGISSAFVIPLIKQLNIKGETYSVLALESAFTDVLCIVFALTVLELIDLQTFSAQVTATKIISLFAVAGLLGIIAGTVWIILVESVFRDHKSYMITIAYLVLVYVATEFLGGNGAIAALFFGLVLKNSRQLTKIVRNVANGDKEEPVEGIKAMSHEEESFYQQISFFLKTFFFVYIGILISFADAWALIIGGIIAAGLAVSRLASYWATRKFAKYDRDLISAIFARGLAAAAVAQLVVQSGLPGGETVTAVTYAVITFTIVLSSVRVFLLRRAHVEEEAKAAPAKAAG